MSWCKKSCGKCCKPDKPEEEIQKEVDAIWDGKSEKKIRQMVNKQREMIYKQCGPWSDSYMKLFPKPQPPKPEEEQTIENAPSPSKTDDKKEAIKDIIKDVKSDVTSEESKEIVKEVIPCKEKED